MKFKKNRSKESKLFSIIAGVVIVILVGCGTYSAYENIAKKAQEEKNELVRIDKLKKKRLEEEKKKMKEEKKKIEEEKKRIKVGVNKDGEQYSYNSKQIWDRLNSRDYFNNGEKIVFLTFDDGPSITNTPKILEILNKNGIKATFFIKGNSLETEEAKMILKDTFDNGHAIGNHTYSHNYKTLYPRRRLNLENFKAELEKNENMIKSVLGENFTTNVVRCPGGYMSWKNMDGLKQYLIENGASCIDWNALNADSEGKKKNAQELINFAIKTSEGKEIVVLLMHDTYGKEETVKSMDGIIKYYKINGYKFKTLV